MAAAVGWPAVASAQTAQELFEGVFGTPAPQGGQQLTLPLFVDGRPTQRLLETVLTPDPGDMAFEATALLEELRPIVIPDVLQSLQRAVDARNRLSPGSLKEVGLEAEFDQARLSLNVVVPLRLRQRVDLTIREGRPPPEAALALPPADYSAFLNLFAAQDVIHTAPRGARGGRQPLLADFDGAINIKSWVIEGDFDYEESRAVRRWQRGDMRLVRDDPARMVRYTAGDFSIPTTGFQSSDAVGGLTFARDFDLQPYRIVQPTARREFELRRPSEVEVFVNDRKVQTLQLPAGPFSLDRFPFTTGVNDVRLRITEDTGRVEVIDFPFFFDSDLLEEGESEFAYSIGFPHETVGGVRKYQRDHVVASMFHRWGATANLTVGAGLQGNAEQTMAQVEATMTTAFGNFRADVGVSRVPVFDSDFKARLQYRLDDPRLGNPWSRSWTLAATYTGHRFAALGQLEPANHGAIDVAGGVSQRLPYGFNVGLTGNYQFVRGVDPDTNTVGVHIGKSLPYGIAANLQLEREVDSTGVIEHRALFTLDIPFYSVNQHVTYTRDTSARSHRADWRYSPPQSVESFSANASMDQNPDNRVVSGDVTYTGTRGRITLDHDATLPRPDGTGVERNSTRTTTARTNSALVFADGVFGLSRPVTNSFAIFRPHPSLDDQRIEINPQGEVAQARVDALGPGVLPELSPYILGQATIEAPDVPIGYDLGPRKHFLLPTNKSGTLVTLGTGATVFLIGRLQDLRGEPVTLRGGEILSLDDTRFKPVLFFTNRSGRFAVEGLKPGRFQLTLYGLQAAVLTIEIAEETAGRHDVGTLTMPIDLSTSE